MSVDILPPCSDGSPRPLLSIYLSTQQSVRAFLAARGCPYLEGDASDVLAFLATELQVSQALSGSGYVCVICNSSCRRPN